MLTRRQACAGSICTAINSDIIGKGQIDEPTVMGAPHRLYKRILVPYDGSQTSDRGLMEAIALAQQMDARLRLLTVLDAFPPRRERMHHALEQALVRTRAAGIASEPRVFEGIAGALLDFMSRAATEWPADLVVIGTHGRQGFSHLIMGSNAEALTRACPVPVLVVPPAAEITPARVSIAPPA